MCKECARAVSRNQQAEKIAYIQKYKLDRGCVDCGYRKHPAALEFDHLPEFEKSFSIGKGCASKGWKSIETELAKCEVICGRCHILRTLARRDDRILETEQQLRKYRRYRMVSEIKLLVGCTDCGWAGHSEALQFDHLPNTTKAFNISNSYLLSVEKILNEIEKCEVVCTNCHAIRTDSRRKADKDAAKSQRGT
jgi:hypothetical protein